MTRNLIFIFLLFSSVTNAERIKPRCTLFNHENKNIITVIRPILNAETRYTPPGKYEVCFSLKVKSSDLVREEMIPLGKNLFDSMGNIVAFAATDFFSHTSPKRIDSIFHRVWIRGFIPLFALDMETVFEYKLEKVINAVKKEFTLTDLNHLFRTFKINLDRNLGSYTSYGLMESSCFYASPKYRTLFIFEGEALLAIIYRRKLSLIHYESQATSAPYTIYYMKKMNQLEKKKVSELFLQGNYR